MSTGGPTPPSADSTFVKVGGWILVAATLGFAGHFLDLAHVADAEAAQDARVVALLGATFSVTMAFHLAKRLLDGTKRPEFLFEIATLFVASLFALDQHPFLGFVAFAVGRIGSFAFFLSRKKPHWISASVRHLHRRRRIEN